MTRRLGSLWACLAATDSRYVEAAAAVSDKAVDVAGSLWRKLASHEGALIAQRAGIWRPLSATGGWGQAIHMHKLCRG